MLDPLSQIPVLDMFMGAGGDPASQIFQDLKRKAEEARVQAQAQNPGVPQPPIDYAGLMTKASQIAAGTPPEATLEPERIEEAARHVGGGGGEQPGPWGRIGRTFQGEEIPADAARAARFRGLADAGVAMMGSASEGNLGRGMAEGMAAFQGGLDRELGGFSERRRALSADELRRRQVEEGLESSREARERARAGEERAVTTYEQSQEDRRAALDAMRSQAEEIIELAGADSPEADRARALLKGGPALRDDLDELHREAIARKRFPEDAAMKTDAEVERLRRLFKEDPNAAFERALELRRTAAYEENAGRYGGGASGDVTATSMLSTVNRMAEDEFERLLLERGGAIALRSYKEGMVPPGVDIGRLRQEAEDAAFATLERQRGRVQRLRSGGEEGQGGGGEGGGGADVDAQLRDLENRARMLGSPLSDEDLRLIRRDLEAGISPQKILDRISGGR